MTNLGQLIFQGFEHLQYVNTDGTAGKVYHHFAEGVLNHGREFTCPICEALNARALAADVVDDE